MKTSCLKRKTPLRAKTGLKKKSKLPISKLQRQLWELCKQIIRRRYPNTCYTCGKTKLEGSNWQTGHLWAKASLGAYLKYDLRVLRPQCFHCNINLGGAGTDFFAQMWQENGEEYMKQLYADRQKTVKAYDHYLQLIDDYKKILVELDAKLPTRSPKLAFKPSSH